MSQLPTNILSQLDVNYYTSLVPFVILYYDYFLTFAEEVERFWNRKNFTWASFLFFVNRYLVLLGNIPVMIEAFLQTSNFSQKTLVLVFLTTRRHVCTDSQNSCVGLVNYNQVFLIVSQLVIGLLLIMRIYALYGRSRWVVVVFLVLGGMAIGVGVWASFSVPAAMAAEIPLQYTGCNSSMDQTQADLLAVAWTGELAFDALVFFFILYKSFVLRRSGNKPLMSMILRDGTLYFAAMTASNLLNILVILTAPPLAKGAGTFFTNVISATMMSHLMLNLRDPRVIEANSRSGRTTEGAAETFLPVLTSVFNADDQRERETNTTLPGPESIEMTPINCGPQRRA